MKCKTWLRNGEKEALRRTIKKQLRRANLDPLSKIRRRAFFRQRNGQLTPRLYNVYLEATHAASN